MQLSLQKVDRFLETLCCALFCFLPFHAFLSVLLKYELGLNSMAISMWKEIVLAVIFVLLSLKMVIEKRMPRLNILHYLIGAYILVSLTVSFVSEGTQLNQIVYGAKYDFVFLLALLLGVAMNFDEGQVKKLYLLTFYSGLVVIIFGLVMHFFIGSEYMVHFGFRNDWSTWYPGQALAYCQKIENSDICRFSGTFAGPNQMGAFLIVWLGIIMFVKNSLRKPVYIISLIIACFALYITYSRAALIGLAVFFFLLICVKSWKVGIGMLAFGFSGILVFFSKIQELFLRPESDFGHLKGLRLGIETISNHPLGLGLGTAGPASYHFGNPIIPENWFLQVGIESGVIGLGLFILILVIVALRLFKNGLFTQMATLIALSVMALFLHTFEDAPTTITFFLLTGLSLGMMKRN